MVVGRSAFQTKRFCHFHLQVLVRVLKDQKAKNHFKNLFKSGPSSEKDILSRTAYSLVIVFVVVEGGAERKHENIKRSSGGLELSVGKTKTASKSS